MKTDEEIIARIEEVKQRDFFGFEASDLIIRLPFEKAKPYLKPDAKSEDWSVHPRDRDSVLKEMADYMEFAWGKANDMRGISAGRSLCHYQSWIWLVGDDLGYFGDYQHYGKDELVKICNHYGWNHAQWDDGVRTNG